MPRPINATLDLFKDWTPRPLVQRYADPVVRASSLRDKTALAVAATLRDCELPRDDIAKRMSDWLGEDVSKPMLDAYASTAKSEHTISFLRIIALAHVSGDIRLLQMAAELLGYAVIESRWLPWVEVGQLADKKEEIDRAFDATRRAARRGARS